MRVREMKNKRSKILSCLILTVSLFFKPLQAMEEGELHTSFGTHTEQNGKKFQEDTFYNSEDGDFFGVFDGHNGDDVSKLLKDNFYYYVIAQKHPVTGLENAFKESENLVKRHKDQFKAGSTAVVAYVDKKNNNVYIGNVGDSRCVIATKDQNSGKYKVKTETEDHKPGVEKEKKRIEEKGGYVFCYKIFKKNSWKTTNRYHQGISKQQFNQQYKQYAHLLQKDCYTHKKSNNKEKRELIGLVKTFRSSGRTSTSFSRSIGDISLKEKNPGAITADPDITVHKIDTSKDEFMILATDGLWDKLSSQRAVDWAGPDVKKNKTPKEIATLLCDVAISQGSKDNITVTVVKFLNPN